MCQKKRSQFLKTRTNKANGQEWDHSNEKMNKCFPRANRITYGMKRKTEWD